MIVIVDYGMGNLHSALKGLEKAGHEAVISDDPADIEGAAGVILPGVGAFKDCFDGLRDQGFVGPLLEAVKSNKPFLGICVGMQLLFEESEEGAGSPGLGVLPGKVVRFPNAKETGMKVPHMGWNQLIRTPGRECPILAHCSELPYVYFVHSYYPQVSEPDIAYATTQYSVEFASVVGRGNIFATQFHPEKSQKEGIGILKAFGEFVQSKTPATV